MADVFADAYVPDVVPDEDKNITRKVAMVPESGGGINLLTSWLI